MFQQSLVVLIAGSGYVAIGANAVQDGLLPTRNLAPYENAHSDLWRLAKSQSQASYLGTY